MEYFCKHCGKQIKNLKYCGYCRKHYDQKLKYGYFLDCNQHSRKDKNLYDICDDYVKVYTFDVHGNISHTFIVDKDNLDLIENYVWGASKIKKKGRFQYYLMNRQLGLFHRHIMGNPSETVDHINRNTFDNRKENLRIVDQTVQNFNTGLSTARFDVKGIDRHRDIKREKRYMARLNNHGIRYSSPWFKTYEEAVYARVLLELVPKQYIHNNKEAIDEHISKLSMTQRLQIEEWFVKYLEREGINVVHRDKDSNLCINFENGGLVTAGARPKHLANKDIIVAENNGDGTFTSHWERIFPSLKA